VRRQKTIGGFPTKRAAQKAEREYLMGVDSGRQLGRQTPKLADYLVDTWLPRRREIKNLKESTYESYKLIIETQIVPSIGQMRIDAIRAQDVETFIAQLQQTGRRTPKKDGTKGLSAKTVNNVLSILNTCLKDATRLEMIAYNPAGSALKPTVRQPEVDFMTPENLMKYVASIQQHRYGPVLQLAALTGMRRGEILGLTWDNVDFQKNTIRIKLTRVRAGNRVIYDSPKSEKSKRTIEVDLDTMSRLRAWKSEQIKERLAFGGTWPDQMDLVVTDPEGKPPSFSAFDRMFQKTLLAAGLEKMKFHSLRHSYVIAALRSGGQLKVVSERVGHADTTITNRVYNHVVEGEDRIVADQTAAFILQKPQTPPNEPQHFRYIN
jgi:integrase